MTADFRQLLTKPAAEIKRPPTLPAGTYMGRLGQYVLGESDKKKTPYVKYPIQLTSATDSIDPSQLQDAEGRSIDITKKQFSHSFYLTPDAEFRVVECAESCGVKKDGKSLGELIAELVGKDVLVDIIVKPGQQNPEETFNDIKMIKGVPA